MRENLNMNIHLNKKHSRHNTINLNLKSRSTHITNPNPHITNHNPHITNPNLHITNPNPHITNSNPHITRNYSIHNKSNFDLYGVRSGGKGCGCGR